MSNPWIRQTGRDQELPHGSRECLPATLESGNSAGTRGYAILLFHCKFNINSSLISSTLQGYDFSCIFSHAVLELLSQRQFNEFASW